MKKVIIGGVGNVLLGDDGIGPYVVHLLEQHYQFESPVTVYDLGTPGLDLVAHLSGIDALILIDSVKNGEPAGTISLYRRDDILRHGPAPVRMDPHSPSLSESLLIADFAGEGPRDVLLIGISADDFEPGTLLSAPVKNAGAKAIDEILKEIRRLGLTYRMKAECEPVPAWWEPVASPILA